MTNSDLRLNPLWRPERARWETSSWVVDLWAEPCLPGESTYDEFLVATLGDRVRLAALDAVVNVVNPTAHDTALRGVAVTRSLLRDPQLSPAQALWAASTALCDPQLQPRHRNSTLTAAVVDLTPDVADIDVAVCADSEVWILTEDGWSSPWYTDMLTAGARTEWEQMMAGNPSEMEAGLAQELLLNDEAMWAYPTLGLFPVPRLRTGHVSGIREVIVSTDGARLNAEHCANLEQWLSEGLQLKPADSPHRSPHGDVTVLHARFRPEV